METAKHPGTGRPLRSFVRREGRITPAQSRALETLWSRYGIPLQRSSLELDSLFGRRAPRYLEIGFGNGDALLAMAQAQPEADFIGIEVHRPGIGRTLIGLQEQAIANVRIVQGDAWDVLEHAIPQRALEGVNIFFPDPWPKKRHQKRRLINSRFVDLLAEKIRPGGTLKLATDWEDYAHQMMAVVSRSPAFRNIAGKGQFSPRLAARPLTRFESRGHSRGHPVWDLAFERKPVSEESD